MQYRVRYTVQYSTVVLRQNWPNHGSETRESLIPRIRALADGSRSTGSTVRADGDDGAAMRGAYTR